MSELSRAGAAAAAPESDIFGWYRELDTKERRTLKACVGGWALDAMDAQLYAFVIPALISVWGITRGEAGQLQTAALLTSAASGWLAGFLADRRPGADPADRHPVVRGLHLPVGPQHGSPPEHGGNG
jgi:hypothetical protein